ncbi:Aldo/keto reductase family protein [Aspergillus niger]|uniref:Aldo/keto reductase family protein n=1 Tax=Aspergillus niger TaxID=5061 RepID=A0A505HVK7_ASPNG|nr:Aldo/keto reductase family protein [Aspergillus niger]
MVTTSSEWELRRVYDPAWIEILPDPRGQCETSASHVLPRDSSAEVTSYQRD